MNRILTIEYKKNPQTAVKNWLRLLNRFDFLDSRIGELRDQIARMEEKGKTGRARALEAKLSTLEKQKESALEEEKKIMDLVLKRAPKKKTMVDFDAESAAEVKAGGGGGGLLDRIRKSGKRKGPGNEPDR